MEKTFQIFERLKATLAQVLEERSDLQWENGKLKQELDVLVRENKELKDLLGQKEEQLRFSQITQAVREKGQGDTSGLKSKIDQMIKDIDRCMAYLSQVAD